MTDNIIILNDEYKNKNSKIRINNMTNLLLQLFDNYYFYIGATNDPYTRINGHKQDYDNISHMFVIGNCKTRERTEIYEKYLINKFGKHYNNIKKLTNYEEGQTGGGEGYKNDTVYIYLLFMNKNEYQNYI